MQISFSSKVRNALVAGLLLIATTAAAAGEKVYVSDFSARPDRTSAAPASATTKWSVQSVDKSPAGDRVFLGQFIDDDVRLTLEKLPPHAFVRISFDLIVVLSWDGSGVESPPGSLVGPDFWRLSVVDGPTLMWHTFSNVPNQPGYADECKVQSYPSPVPGDRVPAMTGAAERNTLGYIFGRTMQTPMDSVYRVSMTVPHTADAITFAFQGGGLQPVMQGVNDESWGLDKVTVETLAEADVKRTRADEVNKLLTRAAALGGDARAANEAFLALLTCNKAARDALRERVGFDAADRQKIAAMIAQLDDADPATRTKAALVLRSVRPAVEWWLWPVVNGHDSPEVRGAAAAVLRGLVVRPMLNDDRARLSAVAARALHAMGEQP